MFLDMNYDTRQLLVPCSHIICNMVEQGRYAAVEVSVGANLHRNNHKSSISLLCAFF